MKAALILVDIQNDFLPGGALAVPNGDEVVPVANAVSEHFKEVIATQDWHPEDHGSFAKTHGKNVGDVIELDGVEQILWPVHCVQNTKGAELAPGLIADDIHYFCKAGEDRNVDSYSGFYDNQHKRSTGLADYLREKGITHLYIMGLATDYCVKYTVLDACALGFQVTVIRDGCRAINLHEDDEAKAFQEMEAAGAELVDSKNVIHRQNPSPLA